MSITGTLLLQNREAGFQHGVGIERDAVDALLDEELGELGVVAWGLAADADLAVLLMTDLDDLRDHRFHGRIPFVENGRSDLAHTIHANTSCQKNLFPATSFDALASCHPRPCGAQAA